MAIKIVKNLNFPNNSDTFQINAVTLEGKTADTVITEARKGLATEDAVTQLEAAINKRRGSFAEKVLLYYGNPNSIGKTWNVEGAVNIYRTYDIIVLGDNYQNPTHAAYEDTVAIIQRLAEVAPNVRVVGYVPIGMDSSLEDSNLPMEELKLRVDQWSNIGAHGIFLDEFGYDYFVTRERQNEIVKYCHDLGKFVFANSWSIEYCFDPNPMTISWLPDFSPNPNGLAPELNENDYYLYENLFYTVDKLDDGSYNIECASMWRIDDVNNYYTKARIDGKSYYEVYGTKICSLDAIPSWYDRTQQNIMKTISIIGAAILNINAVAFGNENWGSSGEFEQWDLPDLDLTTDGLNGVIVELKEYVKDNGSTGRFPYKWSANINGHIYSITFDIPNPDYRVWEDGMRYASIDGTIMENAWANIFSFQSDVNTALSNAETALNTVEETKTQLEDAIATITQTIGLTFKEVEW